MRGAFAQWHASRGYRVSAENAQSAANVVLREFGFALPVGRAQSGAIDYLYWADGATQVVRAPHIDDSEIEIEYPVSWGFVRFGTAFWRFWVMVNGI